MNTNGNGSGIKGRAMRFPAPAGCNIKSVALRETNGYDEESARMAAAARGEAGSFRLELVRLAVVQVDDREVKAPFQDIDSWNSKTRSFVSGMFDRMNATTKDEDARFFAEGVPLDGLPMTSGTDAPSGASG